MGRVQNWDLHSNNFKRLKKDLLPPLDQGFSALLDDLQSLGMLDDTLVVLTGEFGRTPRIGAGGNGTGNDGRDHWSRCFSAVLAGAGVQGGHIIGASDRIGAYPATRAYSPADLAATIYSALGIDLGTELIDKFNRPLQLCKGEPIPVFSGHECLSGSPGPIEPGRGRNPNRRVRRVFDDAPTCDVVRHRRLDAPYKVFFGRVGWLTGSLMGAESVRAGAEFERARWGFRNRLARPAAQY